MLTEVYMSCDILEEDKFDNGCNIKLQRNHDENNVTIIMEDDGGKPILPSEVEISLDELMKALQKLSI
jgi:hypothetical protein